MKARVGLHGRHPRVHQLHLRPSPRIALLEDATERAEAGLLLGGRRRCRCRRRRARSGIGAGAGGMSMQRVLTARARRALRTVQGVPESER